MAAQLAQYKQQAIKLLYQQNKVTDLLAQAEAKTQIKREYLAAGEHILLPICHCLFLCLVGRIPQYHSRYTFL